MKSETNARRFPLLGLMVVVVAISWGQVCVLADEGPSIAKDSVQVLAAHVSGSEDAPKDKSLQWKPGISFRVNGPIADGSQLWVQFGYPDHKDWAKFNCETKEVAKGESLQIDECLAPDKFTTAYVGPVDFSIHLRNELAWTDTH